MILCDSAVYFAVFETATAVDPPVYRPAAARATCTRTRPTWGGLASFLFRENPNEPQSPTPSSDCRRQYLSAIAFLLASALAAVRSLRVRRSSEDSNAASASASLAAWPDKGAAAAEEEEVEATALSSAGIGMDSRPRAAEGWIDVEFGGLGVGVGGVRSWGRGWVVLEREKVWKRRARKKNQCSLVISLCLFQLYYDARADLSAPSYSPAGPAGKAAPEATMTEAKKAASEAAPAAGCCLSLMASPLGTMT